MERLLNALKGQAVGLDAQSGQPRFALVSSVNPEAATARVLLQPEGVLSGWLPVLSPCVGAGWGFVALPSPGDQVLILPQDGDAQHGLIVARAWTASAAPPAAPVGEIWLVHATGSSVRLCNDGTVRVKGDLHVEGDVHDRSGSLDRLRQHYNAHIHPGLGGQTGRPTPAD
jgi:hypothetical protein